MIPRALAIGLSDIQNAIVNLYFASTFSSGSISLFDLAYQIINLPSRIFATTVGQASLPVLSRAIAQKKIDSFRQIVERSLVQSLYIAVPITVLILIQRLTIIRLAFGARQFPWSASLTTAKILAFLLPSIICQTITQILIRSFYAMHNTKTPLYISLVSLAVNFSANIYLNNYTSLGVLGLALAVSLREIVQSFALLFMFIKIVDGLNWPAFFVKIGKIFLTSAVSGFFAWLSIKALDLFILNTTRTLPLLLLFCLSSFFFALIYLFFSRLFSINKYFDFSYHLSRLKHFLS
jgi:putative peptidoglycan lipid II flippase